MHDPSMGQELMHISTGIFNFGHFPQLHLNKKSKGHIAHLSYNLFHRRMLQHKLKLSKWFRRFLKNARSF